MVCYNDIRLSHCSRRRNSFLCPVVQAERGYEGIDAAYRPVSERGARHEASNTPTNLAPTSTCGFAFARIAYAFPPASPL
jgi:hypothetical protein